MTQPQRLGKYELVEVLGKGAMGVVYKAFDPDIDRTVAIKTIRKELIDDDDRAGMMMARFRNEARAAGRLSHPGIVAVYDFGESAAVTYIAMEFVQGNSLREYFNRETRFAERDIVSIMVQLLEALHHAHEQGVWHRDIKPANLIIMNNGRLKVADFGIARIDTSQLTLTGVVMGSPGYMAPEQYSGGRVDWRADLFAAGVVMYQLLTGTRPFTGTTEQVAYKICHERASAPSEVDAGRGWERYDPVIARALAKQPDERFPDAAAFRDAILEAYAAPVSPTVSEETILAEPTVPALFEPSNPSARTHTGATPVPLSVPPLGPISQPPARPGGEPRTPRGTTIRGPQAADAPAGTVIVIQRKWPIAVAAVAVIALAVVAGMLLRTAPEAPRPKQAKAPAAAQDPPAPAVKAEPPKAEPRPPAQRPPETAVAQPAPKPEPVAKAAPRPEPVAKPAPKPEPVAKPAPKPEPPKPAAPEQPRQVAPTPAPKPAAPEPEPKVAAAPPAPPAAAPPKPASARPSEGGGFFRDRGLEFKVQGKLQFSRMWRASGGIVVAARNGVVTLTGTVAAPEDAAEAERIAAAVDGVKAVRNELKVGPVQ